MQRPPLPPFSDRWRWGLPFAIAITIFTGALIPVAHGITFPQWKAATFTSQELADPAVGGDLADPDFDQIPNLIEYAFGTEPFLPDIEEPDFSPASGGLTLIYQERIAASDLLYLFAESPDLQHWITPNTTTRSVLSDNGTVRQVSVSNPNAPAAASTWFNRLQVMVSPGGIEPLSPPTRVDALLEIPLQFKIGWNDNTRIETGFAVERRVGLAGLWEEIGTVGADTVFYTDSDIGGSTSYTYRVSTLQGEFASDYSNEFTLVTPLDTDQDGIPDDMEASYGTNPMLYSSGNNGVSDGWWIKYQLNPFTSPDTDSDGDGRTDAEEFLDGTDPLTPDMGPGTGAGSPLAPEDLRLLTAENGSNELRWTNTSAAAGIIVERTEDGETWRTIAVVGGEENSFTDAAAQPETVYFYRLIAFN